ncbi:general stress protein 26 [Cohnella sp. SGD-V74]|uniref:pyridoxamine 5'-phosphate oxidase family protein n=1 Tax=unclassified Cohnella TaxID=2636738 RepID=UPI000B8BF72F|nr:MULTISPECIES: pyridoxamine 5'-phosphate oxidase family protein [unclassified Cohnella]PRX71871.1 general stress protein 26 [Cohnella sp. SGD-V74]
MNPASLRQAGAEAAKRLVEEGLKPLGEKEAVEKSLALLARSEVVMVGSNDGSGYPNMKAMFKIESEGLSTIWFSTNTSSRRVAQFKKDPKASVYVFDPASFSGLLLVGEMEIMQDRATKRRFWQEGWEAYYPLGVTDEDYCVPRFTAKRGNFYQGLQNSDFEL